MKKLVWLFLLLSLTLTLFCACGIDATPTSSKETTAVPNTTATTAPLTTSVPETTVPSSLVLASDGTPRYRVVTANSFWQENENETAVEVLLDAFENEVGARPLYNTDKEASVEEYEILIGSTSREESNIDDALAFNESIIRVVGNKIIIRGADDYNTRWALTYFVNTYLTGKGQTITVPYDLDEKVTLDMSYSHHQSLSYAEMGTNIWDSFNDAYWKRYWVAGNAFWDTAEILETYVDVYEATKDPAIKEKVISYADWFLRAYRSDWTWNDYNDDIMWICIAYCRISILTGETKYYDLAKTNFDATYARAYDTELGGGLYWRTENETKNSCVNCPGAIAACLLGQLSGDESYYEKAKGLIDWELENMFVKETGQVYDAYPLEGRINTWASTYNQGTFIGACTYLYEHYKDENYLVYAAKAAEYAMNHLTNDAGIIDNNETGGNDLPGFKGILVRWLYRYAKATEDLDILRFLQDNADAVYDHRNADGLVWTDWERQTPDDVSGQGVFSMSTVLALMYNCQPWW